MTCSPVASLYILITSTDKIVLTAVSVAYYVGDVCAVCAGTAEAGGQGGVGPAGGPADSTPQAAAATATGSEGMQHQCELKRALTIDKTDLLHFSPSARTEWQNGIRRRTVLCSITFCSWAQCRERRNCMAAMHVSADEGVLWAEAA